MSELQQEQNYLELFDISKKTAVAKAPLAAISHLGRVSAFSFPSTGREIGKLIRSWRWNTSLVANRQPAKGRLSHRVWFG
jgi:hypothetical protein